MAKYSGRLVKLGVAKEGTRGTLPASYTYHIPHVSMSFDDKVVKARSTAGMGVLADSEEAFVTTKYGAGDLEGEVRGSSFGLFLYNLLGSLSTSGDANGYTHAFTISQVANPQSLALLMEDSNTTEEYPLVMIDTLELTSALDEVLMFSASFMSKKGNTSAKSVPALTDEYKFTKKHLSVKIASTIGGLSGATAISVKNLTLTLSKGVVLDDVLGTAEPEDILATVLSVEGQLTLNYEDETYKNYMRDGSAKAMEIAWTNSDETIGAGATNPSLTFQFPNVDFLEWEADYSLDSIVGQTFSFKASRDVANTQNIIHLCNLINGVSSY